MHTKTLLLMLALMFISIAGITSDDIIVPANQGKAYLKDNSGNLYPASIVYTTDGNSNVVPIASSISNITIGTVNQGTNNSGANPWYVQDVALKSDFDAWKGWANVNLSTVATDAHLVALSNKFTDNGSGAITVDGSAVTQPVSGTVAVNNFPATQTVNGSVTANIGSAGSLALDTSVQSINGKFGSLGQKTMAGSAPVVIASDQSAVPASQSGSWYSNTRDMNGVGITSTLISSHQALDVNAVGLSSVTLSDLATSGSLTAACSSGSGCGAGSTVPLSIDGMSSARINVTGTWSGTILADVSLDNFTTFKSIVICGLGGTPSCSSSAGITSNGYYTIVGVGAAVQIRARMSAYTSGTASIQINASAGNGTQAVVSQNAANFLGTIYGSNASNPIQNDSSGNMIVVGNVGSGGSDSGAPVKVGGVYNTTPITLTNAERGDLQLDSSGRLQIRALSTSTDSLNAAQSGVWSTREQDGSGNALTSQTSGGQRALDVGVNVAGVQVDPRSIRSLTAADVVSSNTRDGSGNSIGSTSISSTNYLDIKSGSSGATGSAVPSYGEQIAGTDGTNLQAIGSTLKGTQGTYGITTQAMKDSGRTYVVITLDRATGVTTEALATMTINKGGTVTTGTSYTVTSGKTLRLQSMVSTVIATTATATYGRVRLRAAATVSATSGIIVNQDIASGAAGGAAAAAGAGQSLAQNIPDGLEIASGQEIGISQIISTTSSTVSVSLIGYEY